MSAETALATQNGAMQTWTDQQVDVMRRTVAKDCTQEEFQMFLYLASRYHLDPFLKQIWAIKMGGQVVIMTSRDGYLSTAQRHPDYEGMSSMVVREGDVFEFDAIACVVNHKFGAKRGPILGAYAVVHRRGRKPVVTWAPFEEYNRRQNAWQTNPSAMIVKCAEAAALKRQFDIAGLVTAEEMPPDYALPTERIGPASGPVERVMLPPGKAIGTARATVLLAKIAEALLPHGYVLDDAVAAWIDDWLREWGYPNGTESGLAYVNEQQGKRLLQLAKDATVPGPPAEVEEA